MLQQANRQIGHVCVLSAQEPTSKITPSLASLDDAHALRRRDWRRGEPSEDIPRQYSTMCRHLTPTQPRHEDMRMDSTLDVPQRDLLVTCQLPQEVMQVLGGNTKHKRPLRLK